MTETHVDGLVEIHALNKNKCLMKQYFVVLNNICNNVHVLLYIYIQVLMYIYTYVYIFHCFMLKKKKIYNTSLLFFFFGGRSVCSLNVCMAIERFLPDFTLTKTIYRGQNILTIYREGFCDDRFTVVALRPLRIFDRVKKLTVTKVVNGR